MIRLARIALLILAVDQASKLLVGAFLPTGKSVAVLPGFFYLSHVRNYGAAFGLMGNRPGFFVFVAVAVVAVIVIAYHRLAEDRHLVRWGLALQVGGSLGNLVDRLRNGSVTDFIDLRVWPVFNVADMAIVAGVALLCWELLRNERAGSSKQES